MSDVDSLEQRLADAYRRQTQHYENALRIANGTARSFEHYGWANDLQFALKQVANIEEEMAADKIAWKNSNKTPGFELRSILTNIATQIHSLAKAIEQRVQEIEARKERLLPALDEFIRHRHMLQSYGHYAK